MRSNKSLTQIFILGILTFSLSSCSFLKKNSSNFEDTDRKTSKLVTKMIDNQVQTDWLMLKARAGVNMDGQKLNFPTEIRIKKDEFIWGTAKKLGFEVGRFLMTPDSVYVINRLGRSYEAMDWQTLINLSDGLPISFNLVQQALLGNPVFFSNSFEMENEGKSTWIRSESNTKIGRYEVDKEGQMTAMELIDKNNNNSVLVNMEEFGQISNEQQFSFFRTFEVFVDEKNEASLKVDISKAETEGPFEFPFSIPKKYSKGIFPAGSK